jgi:hypothetical protein
VSTELVRYDAMCRAIAAAYDVDEVKDIRDKALAIEVYARQAQNYEAEHKAAKVRERAERRAGELLAEREMAKGGGDQRSDHRSPHVTGDRPEHPSNQPKTLADLGITKRQSANWQKLAKMPLERFERALEEPSLPAMRSAIREALVETLGEPPDRTKVVSFRAKPDPIANAAIDLTGSLRQIAELPHDMAELAARTHSNLTEWHLNHAATAQRKIAEFVTALKRRRDDAA